MKVIATPIKGKDLKPGDLFSTAGPEYWDNMNRLSIGERCYIRTDAPHAKDDGETEVYKLEIVIDGHSG